MKLKVIIALLLVLFLISVAVADAKSSGRGGGRSGGSSSKSFSSKATGFVGESAAKVAAITTGVAAVKSTKKKKHFDDDLFENESENETAEQSPGMGAMGASLALGALMLARRRGRTGVE